MHNINSINQIILGLTAKGVGFTFSMRDSIIEKIPQIKVNNADVILIDGCLEYYNSITKDCYNVTIDKAIELLIKVH